MDELKENFKDICCTITGSDNSEKRNKAVEDFQAGNKKVAICNIIAGGVGLTLTSSQTVIFQDFSFLPSDHIQAEDRIHRIGQNKKCNIYYMYAKDTIDENIANMIGNKLQNINQIIDNKNESFITELIKSI